MKNNMFLIKENSDGTLIFLSNKNDPYQMNWIEGDHAWGTVIVPEGIKVTDLVARGRFPYRKLLGGLQKEDFAAVEEALEMMGITELADACVDELSGGQRQAMALLMSTMTPIEFLILDEHTAALDPKTAELIMELTAKIVKEKNLTTIMVTHNLRYAIEYGNRLVMMHQGNAILDKKGEEKAKMSVDDILALFNEISIECGN